MTSGDQENPTQKTAMEMDIETCYFEALSENKAEIIKELQKKAKKSASSVTASTVRWR
ncbi:MAG: hypothetical protein HQK72_09345 [Desulfamplus sp.]|nr:hypothetical protein [Desulfamplus sp.]